MATFFDRGREKAKHIVGRVGKAGTVKKDSSLSHQNSLNEPAEVALGTPVTSRRADLTAFKHPLDDTDTLPVCDINLSDDPRTLQSRDGDSSHTSSATGLPFYQSPNSYCSNRFGPVPYHPWDMPLMSFVPAAKAMAPREPASDAVGVPVPPSEDHEALSAPDTPTNSAADAPAHVEVRVVNTPPADAAKAQMSHNRVNPGAGKQATPASAQQKASAADVPAARTLRRPGVADAATLIAPGLVAKRRAAAIAAVENKDGPSPELQASPVIETEGAGDPEHKTGDRVKLSAW